MVMLHCFGRKIQETPGRYALVVSMPLIRKRTSKNHQNRISSTSSSFTKSVHEFVAHALVKQM